MKGVFQMKTAVKVTSGLTRVLELLSDKEEINVFQKDYEKIHKLYVGWFYGISPTKFLEIPYMLNYDFSEYEECAKTIINKANSTDIYLDRPNDPMCCLVLGIEKLSRYNYFRKFA